MKIRIAFFVLLLITGVRLSLLAQDGTGAGVILEAKRLMHEAVTLADGDLFHKAKTLIEPLTNDHRFSALAHYYLGYINYQVAITIERMDKDRAVLSLDRAVAHLEAATEKDEQFAEAYALLASCYGIKTSFAPLKGIVWGPKSNALVDRAKKLAPRNPRVAFLDAIGTYSTPVLFGGGKEKGLKGMRAAAELFDQWEDSDPLQPSWGKEEVYAWIGRAYMEQKEYILARKAFEKSLEINERFAWVKNHLLPALERRAQAEKR
ncbi:MAG: tetratricopeptide repeat protein [Ignavibacteria bacterium]|nr:tetratricopeptide repeat protein [Ignavibacteria bacterium]